MEIPLTPDLQAKLRQLATQQGRAPQAQAIYVGLKVDLAGRGISRLPRRLDTTDERYPVMRIRCSDSYRSLFGA